MEKGGDKGVEKVPEKGAGRDEPPVVPRSPRDETDEGWGEHRRDDDDRRLLEDRPPHWGSD